MNIKDYTIKALLPILKVTILALLPTIIIYYCIPSGSAKFFIVVCCSILSSGISIWLQGITSKERNTIKNIVLQKIPFFKKNQHDTY